MNPLSRRLMTTWMSMGPRMLPFADVATPDLPLSRLLRLSLFQVTVGMTMVLLVGTMNRVMIVELGVPASIVGIMIALPLVFAPFRALIGFNSDTHRSELGWRRVPFIWKGTLAQFSGYAIMPLALLVLAGKGQSGSWPAWVGQGSAALSFALVGAGMHTVQTTGLALATDLTPPESHPKVVGLMYVMLLIGMIGSALVFGVALMDFSPGRLVQVIQSTAVAVMVLNVIAMWKQEVRRPPRGQAPAAPDPSFRESWATFCQGDHTIRRLVIVGIGTLGFGLADVLLEPFGGQILELEVAATTKLTALFAFGGLTGFGWASHRLDRGGDAYRVSRTGALLGVPGFGLILLASGTSMMAPFLIGNFLIGFGGALFGHGTLTATMNRAPESQAGLALGAWGSVQATAAGLAMALSGVLRDVVNAVVPSDGTSVQAVGYEAVYGLEIVLLVVTIWAISPLVPRLLRPTPKPETAAEPAAESAGGAC
ncbi:MAG TPA: PucC family protein [Myxococcales bacterium LLY-WYZ-16_1]|jgi:MFS transporter, BCD family, chlorophyll transporter|nr:PucC family protein [Myxococcales bacterium LLY-WYZ-16_1]